MSEAIERVISKLPASSPIRRKVEQTIAQREAARQRGKVSRVTGVVSSAKTGIDAVLNQPRPLPLWKARQKIDWRRQMDIISRGRTEEQYQTVKGELEQYKQELLTDDATRYITGSGEEISEAEAIRQIDVELARIEREKEEYDIAISQNIESSQELDMALSYAHPDTKVKEIKTDEGISFEIQYPYEGAEHYGDYKSQLEGYKKSDPWGYAGLVVATSLTPEDPLGIPSAYYTLAGKPQQAEDIKIKSISRIKGIEETKDTWTKIGKGALWTFESPVTQIASSIVIGAAFAKVLPVVSGFAKGFTVARYGTTFGKYVPYIASGIAGGRLITVEASNIYSKWEKGQKGEAIGQLGLLGFKIAGAYVGFKLAGGREMSQVLSKRGEEIYSTRFQKGFEDIRIGVKGIKGPTHTSLFLRKTGAMPIEQDSLFVSSITEYGYPSRRPALIEWFKDPMSYSKFKTFVTFRPEKIIIVGDKGFGPQLKGIFAKQINLDKVFVEADASPFILSSKGNVLFKGGDIGLITGQTGQLGKKIFTFDVFRIHSWKQNLPLGGFTETIQETIPKSVFIETIPIFEQIPWSSDLPSIVISPSLSGLYGKTPIFKTGQYQDFEPIQFASVLFGQKLAPQFISMPNVISVHDLKQDSSFVSIPIEEQVFVQEQIQEQMSTLISQPLFSQRPTVQRYPSFVKKPKPFFGLPFLPLTGSMSSGKSRGTGSIFDDLFRFRMGDIYDPFG